MPDDFDEMALWAALRQGVWPRSAGAAMGMDPARVVEICERWSSEGIYDYGVSADLGWIAVPPNASEEDLQRVASRAYSAGALEYRRQVLRVDNESSSGRQ